MPKLKSCGFLIYRDQPQLSFLLMQHPARWDLPKGHVDKGETDMQCALRELEEETGIASNMIDVDPDFNYEQQYMVSLPKYNHEPRLKRLVIFLAKLKMPDFSIQVTEHNGFQWINWNPPHDIQAKTINPLLAALENHWQPQISQSTDVR